MQQQTAHLAGDQRVKFFTGRLWSHLFGRTSGRWRPTAGHRAGRADGAPAEKRGGAVRGLAPLAGVCLFLMGMATIANGQYSVNFDGSSDDTHATTYGFTGKSWNGIAWDGVQVIVPTTPLGSDWYNGVRSARLRGYSTSHMTMVADKTGGAGTISFNYRRYSTDAQVTWRVDFSTDGGSTWTQAGSTFTADATVRSFSATVNRTGNVRIRIIHHSGGASSNKRMNIDDLTITDYSPSGDVHINPLSAGTPSGTYYLGDTMGEWFYNFEIGQSSWDNAQVGIGTALDGTGYNWGTASWYQDGDGNNKRVRRNLSGYQYTAVGNHYVICQARSSSSNPYTSKSGAGWGNYITYPPSDLTSAYFTCLALNDPGNQSATAAGTTSISLGWAKNGQGHDVMIVRSTDSNFTAPTGGTTYTPGSSTIGGDLVVYRGGATNFTDTGLSAGTTYYYKFYSENWTYYSAGVTASATTHTPTPTIVLADNGTQVAAGNVAAGTTAHVLSSFKVTVTVAKATLTKVAFTTAGTYQTADISNLKLLYSTDATLDTGDATRWGSTTLERANPLRLVRPWRNEPGFRGGEFQYSIFNIQCPISTVQVAGVISHAKPPAFAKATVGKPRREGESWQGCLARLFDQRSTTNNQRPLPPTNFNCALNG